MSIANWVKGATLIGVPVFLISRVYNQNNNGCSGPQGYVSRGPNKGKPVWSTNADGSSNGPIGYKYDGTPLYPNKNVITRGSDTFA